MRLIPQPVANAGLGTPGTAAALVDRGARGTHGLEPRQADVGLVARHPRHPGIDDNAHALDGQRGLGNRSRQHHLAAPFWRRGDRAVLHGGIKRAVQRHDLDVRIVHALGQQILGAADFGRARQERQHRTWIGAQRGRNRVRHLPLQRRVWLAAEIARLDRKGAAFACYDRRLPEQFCDPCAIERCGHDKDAQLLTQAGLRVARQRQSQIGVERALVKFVEQDGGDAGQFGVIENLAREDALGDDFNSSRPRDL